MFNKAILAGRLTADPELKQTPAGVSVTSFSIAVNRAYAPKGGERQTDFLDIVAWRSTAEFICKYFGKGKAILIEGNIQTRSYADKNGQNRRVWEIVAEGAHFVEGKGETKSGAKSDGIGDLTLNTEGNTDDFEDISDDGDLPF